VVASSSYPLPHWATFFGPYRHLLGVRASGWSVWFEDYMVASVAAQELKEDLASIDALIGDLVSAGEAEAMVGRLGSSAS
jgi:hypothetical protein